MMTHADIILHFRSSPLHQGKVRVIAAMLAAAHARRTGESRKTGPGKTANVTMADELKQVTSVLEDHKAQNLVVIPLKGQTSFADYLVIASGTSTRHVSSIGQALKEKLGKSVLGLEGVQEGEWVCADLGNIVVHLFVPEKRALYNLEKLWSHVFTDTE